MKRSELTGLVLTHGERDPMLTLEQLAVVCGQVVLVQDTRTDVADLPLERVEDKTELTVVERDFDTFPGQRNAGIDKARGSWVLSVDSDEHLSRDLAVAITHLEPSLDNDVFGIPRQENFQGRALRGRLYCNYHPRLFRSSLRYGATPEVHEEFEDFDYETLAFLDAPLVHDMNDSLADLCSKSFDYGRTWQESHPDDAYSLRRLAFASARAYKQAWRDGVPGLGMAAVQFSYELGRRLSA